MSAEYVLVQEEEMCAFCSYEIPAGVDAIHDIELGQLYCSRECHEEDVRFANL